MRNPRGVKLWKFAEIIQYLNNLLPKLPGSGKSKNITQEELNEILLHTVSHGWAKQAMMFGIDF